MRSALFFVIALACTPPKDNDGDNPGGDDDDVGDDDDAGDDDDGDDDDGGDDDDASTGSTGESTPTGDTGPPPIVCDPEVTAVSARRYAISTMIEVDVTVDVDAAVAVWCAADLEPEQVFFAESTVATTDHTVRLWGLVPGLAYTCTAVPVCDASGLSVGTSLTTPYNADFPPDDIGQLTVTNHPKYTALSSWTMAPFTVNMFTATAYVVVYGPEGRPRWWMALPNGVGVWVEARYHAEDDTLVWGGGMHEDGRMRIIDMWEGEAFAFEPPGWQQEEFHHDGKRIDDGRLMSLEIRQNNAGNTSWDGFGVRVVDPATGLVEVDYDSQRLVDAGQLPNGGGFNFDPWHANWADVKSTPTGDMIYVSLCFDYSILAIDAASGDLRWKLARGEGWTLLDDQGNALSENLLPQCQHGLEVDGDKLLVYDNGQDRALSSAQEWQIDEANHTATLLWSWQEPSWKEDFLGDIDYLPSDRVLITEASIAGVADIVEVDRSTGDVVNRMSFDSGGVTYRSERYDGCTLFSSARDCAVTGERYADLEALLP